MLGKILFFVLLGVLAYCLWAKRKREVLANEKPDEKHSEKIIVCPVCGVHFVESEGVWAKNRMVCSPECAQKSESIHDEA